MSETEHSQSTESQDQSGQSASGSDAESNEIEVNRSAEEYARDYVKVVEESKRRKQKLRELSDEKEKLQQMLEDYERKQLESDGKIREAYEYEKKKRSELEENLKKERARMVWERVTSQVKTQAQQMGCVAPDDLVELLSKEKQLDLDYDPQTYSIDKDQVKDILEQAREKRAFLFSKSAPPVVSGVPKKHEQEKKDFSKMSLAELKSEYGRLAEK